MDNTDDIELVEEYIRTFGVTVIAEDTGPVESARDIISVGGQFVEAGPGFKDGRVWIPLSEYGTWLKRRLPRCQ